MPVTYQQRRAQARLVLPSAIFDYFDRGAGEERSLGDDERAWAKWWLCPHGLRDVSQLSRESLRTTVLNTPLATPVMVAPMAAQMLAHPEGEVAMAAGVASAGSLLVVSTRSTRRLTDIAAHVGPWWMQVYALRDRGLSDEIALEAAALGAQALVLTADTPILSRRRYAESPVWPSGRAIANLEGLSDDDHRNWQAANVTEAEISRLAHLSGLPIVVKGVLRADDASRYVEAGAGAVIVSTHGGRQLDGVVPAAQVLPTIVDAVADRAEVYVDGGLRSGRDVLRALALGARAALVGKPVLWGLVIGGSGGVAEVLNEYGAELVEAMALCGLTHLDEADLGLVTRQPC